LLSSKVFFSPKCSKYRSAAGPTGGAYSALPDIAGLKGPKGRGGEEKGGEENGVPPFWNPKYATRYDEIPLSLWL